MKIFWIFIGVFVRDAICVKILPEFFPQCKRRDPRLEECVLSAVEDLKPRLLKGIPQIKMSPYDPFKIPYLMVNRKLEAVQVKSNFTDITLTGFNGYEVKKLKINLEKLTAQWVIVLPKISLSTYFDITGRILQLGLGNSGFAQGNFTNVRVIDKAIGKVVQKDGVDYLQVKLKTKVIVGGGVLNVVDENSSTSYIATLFTELFNRNTRLILDIISPIVDDAANTIFSAFVNRIFGTIPMSEIFIDE